MSAFVAFLVLTVTGLAGCGHEGPTEPTPPVEDRIAETPASDAAEAQEPARDRRGLWVLCEGSQRVLEDPARIERLIDDAQALAATDLFVQVYRGGRAWYAAELADAAPHRTILATAGTDTLQLLVERAHEAGLRVHAWVNVLSLSKNGNAPILRTLGRDAVLTDRKGRSLLDYPGYEVPGPDREYYRMGTPGLYLDAGAPGVRERLVAVFEELLTGYPELDGLHLDYIRHPGVLPLIPGSRFGVGLDFGYGAGSRARFEEETRLKAPTGEAMVNLGRWDSWRREQVTALVAAIGEKIDALDPELELSAAVISYADRAYLTLAQDWLRWVEDDLIDFAVPMIYTLDDRLLRYQAERFAGHPDAERIWAGLGSWLFATRPDRAAEQLAIAEKVGLRHHALFSYDSMADAAKDGSRPLMDRLRATAPDAPEPDGSGAPGEPAAVDPAADGEAADDASDPSSTPAPPTDGASPGDGG